MSLALSVQSGSAGSMDSGLRHWWRFVSSWLIVGLLILILGTPSGVHAAQRVAENDFLSTGCDYNCAVEDSALPDAGVVRAQQTATAMPHGSRLPDGSGPRLRLAADSVAPQTPSSAVSYSISEAGVPVAGSRTTGINRAWSQERDLLNAGGGTRSWSAGEARDLWMNGSVPGCTGHHINSVDAFPDWAGDPRNIRFLTNGHSTNEHLYSTLGHGGAWQNQTSGDLIDRSAMIAQAGN